MSVLWTIALMAHAQYDGNGYYRVQNTKTERYIEVLDDRGSLDFSTTDADLNALKTYAGFESVVSNPASIIYTESHSGGYILYSQGTDTYSIVEQYLKLYDNKDGTYKAYATNSGLTKYIIDEDDVYSPGYVLTGGRSAATGNWYLNPVNNTTEDFYFGITPDTFVGSSNYKMFYASFPFNFESSGMTAYYIDRTDMAEDGTAYASMKEVTATTIPAATPVIISCSATHPSDNRLNLVTSSAKTYSDNLLTGVYFCNDVLLDVHRNVVDNNPETMRVLGVTSDGELGMILRSTSDMPYIPANTAYLTVTKYFPADVKLVAEGDYERVLEEHGGKSTDGISAISSDGSATTGVYTILGTKICEGNTLPAGLPAGVYIVGGRKVVVR